MAQRIETLKKFHICYNRTILSAMVLLAGGRGQLEARGLAALSRTDTGQVWGARGVSVFEQ